MYVNLETYDKTKQMVENGNSGSNDPANNPHDNNDHDPDGPSLNTVGLNKTRTLLTEKLKHELDRDLTVDDTSDNNGRGGKTVGDLGEELGSGTESRRFDTVTGKAVDDGSSDGVEDDLENLENHDGLPEIAGLLHLGEDSEEGDVAG